MSATVIYRELRTRYINGWTPPPTEYPNESFVKPNGVIWARFKTELGQESQMDIGDTAKTFRTLGVVMVQLFAPQDQGSVALLQMADDLAEVFRNWYGATVACGSATIKDIGTDSFGWYQVNIVIPFKSDALH